MKFAEIIGQELVKKRLMKTVRNSRISHAQLFLGPQGSGKLALALAYAQYINCNDRTDEDSCGVCPSCAKYEKFAHPDLHFIFPTAPLKSKEKPISLDYIKQWRELLTAKKGYVSLSAWHNKIGIERKQSFINTRDCNEIIKLLSYKSYEANYKVMIIWMVEKLHHAAAPKILKILEEPPDKTLFVLVSENQDMIISTILSRTQLVKITGIDNESLTDKLIRENHEPAKVKDVVNLAKGNYIEAEQLLEQTDEIDQNLELFSKWMRLCFSNKFSQINDFVSVIAKLTREQQKSFLKYALRMIRECMLISNDSVELAKLNTDESSFVYGSGAKRFYPFINNKNAYQLAEEVNKSVYHIERNANPNILFFDLSLKIGELLKA